jgi:signal transduction histidine kinase
MAIEEIVIGMLAFFLTLIIIAFIVFIVQRNKQKFSMENDFKIKMAAATKKLQEQTLKDLSADILDSFGNNLLVIKLNMKQLEGVAGSLKRMSEKIPAAPPYSERVEFTSHISDLQAFSSRIESSVTETKKTLEHMVADMMTTTVRLTRDVADNSFLKNLENELKRLDGNTFDKEVIGKEYPLGKEKEIMLLYICQQVLDNVIQHSKTQKLKILISYTPVSFSLKLEDYGIGFHQKDLPALMKSGKGFQNMTKAAQLINANLSIKGQPHEGTAISIDLEILSN